MRDVLPRPLQPQHGVVERESLEHGDGVGDASADLESKSPRPAGGEERQHRRVAHAQSRHLCRDRHAVRYVLVALSACFELFQAGMYSIGYNQHKPIDGSTERVIELIHKSRFRSFSTP